MFGYPIAYVDNSHITVGFPNANAPTSTCKDHTNTIDITLSGQNTINTATHGAANGDDSFTGAGTVTVSGGTKSVTGSGTAFLSVFQTRTCTGTISSSNGGTAVTGTNTKFMSEFTVGDLIGTAGNGFYQIISIASDTSLTLSGTNPPATGFSSATPSCIENPSIKISTNATTAVVTITSNTALTTLSSQTAQSGASYVIGRVAGDAIPGFYGFVFVGQGSSGTTTFISNQRTTPYGLTGYNSYYRRIGSICYDSSGNILAFNQWGLGLDRNYTFELPYTSLTLVSAQTANTWTTQAANKFVPPTATVLNLFLYNNTANDFTYARKTGAGSATTTRAAFASSSGCNSFTACDGQQNVDTVVSTGTGSVYIYGYIESLAW